MNNAVKTFKNSESIPLNQCPCVSIDDFKKQIITATNDDAHLSALFVLPEDHNKNRLFAVLNFRKKGELGALSTVVDQQYSALTPDCQQAHYFEREIFEQHQIEPIGHPWLKPVRFDEASKQQHNRLIGHADFFQVEGEDIHEVAVGPVHAGVIEPGHFRFQCQGEIVLHLEISLGYQHRGIEQRISKSPDHKSIHYIETAAGDSTIGHTTAYCQVLESLTQTPLDDDSRRIRCIAAELERLANHVGDLGALAGDVGFLPTLNYCGRIRGDILNLTALICGNRFGRGLVIPGGVAYNLSEADCQKAVSQLRDIEGDTMNALNLMFETPSVLARFEATGIVSKKTAHKIGLVGVAGRASGLKQDVRTQHPYALYDSVKPDVPIKETGDCAARARVRYREVVASFGIVKQLLKPTTASDYQLVNESFQPDALCVSLVEGWRGEICHVAVTGSQGQLRSYKIIDPSFHNWFGLACSLRNQQISDFPLCNKSFNLSYCGHDL